MYIASDDLIGGHGDHYFMFYALVGNPTSEPVCSFGSIRPSLCIILGPVLGPYCRVWKGLFCYEGPVFGPEDLKDLF